jgi:hypothetical protein
MSNCVKIDVTVRDWEADKLAKKIAMRFPQELDMGPVNDKMEEWVWQAVEDKFRREGNAALGIDGVLLDIIREEITEQGV